MVTTPLWMPLRETVVSVRGEGRVLCVKDEITNGLFVTLTLDRIHL